MPIPHGIVSVAALLLVAAATVHAQEPGIISGGVTDPSGAGIAGVAVTLARGAGTPSTTATTDAKGGYAFPTVAAGIYTLSFQLDSFKKFVRSNVIMNAGVALHIDARMEPWCATEKVPWTFFRAWGDSDNFRRKVEGGATSMTDYGAFGMICGTVTDPSGAGTSGVAVTLVRGAETPLAAATADARGRYFLPNVSAGTYSLTFVLAGFEQSVQPNVTMTAGSNLRADQALGVAAPALAQDRPTIGEPITTESGRVYKFTQLGKGAQPQPGDLMIIQGIGTLADGKEFWNTRTDGAPYEYTLGVDSVIRGFSEGMRHVREGDRIIITMKPELGYGARERPGIPANSTLTFDYEILAVKPLTFAKLVREALAAGTVDDAIATVKATPSVKGYYASASNIQAAANAANRKEAGANEKVLALGLTLLPDAYQLHQTLGRLQATRGDKTAAIRSYETALKLNPKKTATEIRDYETTTAALAALR